MGDRTRNMLIGVLVLFAVLGAGTIFILPYLNPEPGVAGPGAAEFGQARRLMEGGKFAEAQSAYQQVIQEHPGTPAAARAQVDTQYGIPYHQAVRLEQAGQPAEARALLARVARDGGNTEWGPKASSELNRLGPPSPAAGGPGEAGSPGTQGSPTVAPARSAGEQARQSRLAQANSLLESGRTEQARKIYQSLVDEGVDDAAGTAARLALATLQATGQAAGPSPEVDRARVALHRARASLLAYRGANGRYPATLEDRGLEQFGFSYRELLADVRRVESYRPEGGNRFEITAVARDARPTRLRATDRSVEDLP